METQPSEGQRQRQRHDSTASSSSGSRRSAAARRSDASDSFHDATEGVDDPADLAADSLDHPGPSALSTMTMKRSGEDGSNAVDASTATRLRTASAVASSSGSQLPSTTPGRGTIRRRLSSTSSSSSSLSGGGNVNPARRYTTSSASLLSNVTNYSDAENSLDARLADIDDWSSLADVDLQQQQQRQHGETLGFTRSPSSSSGLSMSPPSRSRTSSDPSRLSALSLGMAARAENSGLRRGDQDRQDSGDTASIRSGTTLPPPGSGQTPPSSTASSSARSSFARMSADPAATTSSHGSTSTGLGIGGTLRRSGTDTSTVSSASASSNFTTSSSGATSPPESNPARSSPSSYVFPLGTKSGITSIAIPSAAPPGSPGRTKAANDMRPSASSSIANPKSATAVGATAPISILPSTTNSLTAMPTSTAGPTSSGMPGAMSSSGSSSGSLPSWSSATGASIPASSAAAATYASSSVSPIQSIPSASAVRLSSTPFLPSPLAQASLAPGEEEGEAFDFLGLDEDTSNNTSTASASSSSYSQAQPGLFTPLGASGGGILRRDTGRSSRPLEPLYSSIPAAGLRRSSSTSQSYRSSPSRRRISVGTPSGSTNPASVAAAASTSTVQAPSGSVTDEPGLISGTALGLSVPRSANISSGSSSAGPGLFPTAPQTTYGAASVGGTSSTNVIAPNNVIPSTPSPLRREASLLSRSRDLADSSATRQTLSDHSLTYSAAPRSTMHYAAASIDSPGSPGSSFAGSPSSSTWSSSAAASQPLPAPPSAATGLPLSLSPRLAAFQASSNSSPSKSALQATRTSPTSSFSRASPAGGSRYGSGSHSYAPSGSFDHAASAGAVVSDPNPSPPHASLLSSSASSPGLDTRIATGTYTLSPVRASSILATSPQPRTFTLSSSSLSMSRGSHGRSESLSSVSSDRFHPSGIASGGGGGGGGLAMSPSTSLRSFPSAPPMVPGSLSSSFSPPSSMAMQLGPAAHTGSAGTGTAGSSGGISPTSSVISAASRADSGSGASLPVPGSIKLQRVPTSVRLAQDLHPISPIQEKRRTSIDAATSLSTGPPVVGRFSLAGIGSGSGSGSGSSSNSQSATSSETERKDRRPRLSTHGSARLLPPTPAATRENTPSPQGDTEGEERQDLMERMDVDDRDRGSDAVDESTYNSRTGHLASSGTTSESEDGRRTPDLHSPPRLMDSLFHAPARSPILASSFGSSNSGSAHHHHPRSPRQGSRSTLTPPTLAYAAADVPLFPFSLPGPAATLPPNSKGESTRSPTLSRSQSRTRGASSGGGSPVARRPSPLVNQDPFQSTSLDDELKPAAAEAQREDASALLTPRVEHSSSPFSEPSLSTRAIPCASSPFRELSDGSGSASFDLAGTSYASPPALKRVVTLDSPDIANRHSFLAPPSEEALATFGLSDMARTVTHENVGTGGKVGASVVSSPDRKKAFRTSMLPSPTSVSASTSDDYARHLLESRASKLRKWAGSATASTGSTGGIASAANTVTGSDLSATIKGKRRAGIPDFSAFGYSTSGTGGVAEGGYRDEAGGDIGTGMARPGTAGSKEIEWVDWLDEYKRMKEAKIKAEQAAMAQQQDQTRESEHQQLGDVGNEDSAAMQLEAEDVAGELGDSPARKHSDDANTRRGSDDRSSGKGRRSSVGSSHNNSPQLADSTSTVAAGDTAGGTSLRRRLSAASVVSLSMMDHHRRRQVSHEPPAPPTTGLFAAPTQPAHAVTAPPQRRGLAARSVSYAPASSTSQAPAMPAHAQAPQKKKKNLGAKIENWWSAVTKSFAPSQQQQQSSPQSPAAPLRPSVNAAGTAVNDPSASKRPTLSSTPSTTSPAKSASGPAVGPAPVALQTDSPAAPRPAQPRAASDTLAVDADPIPPGRISGHFERTESLNLPVASNLRHASSASNLAAANAALGPGSATSPIERRMYGAGTLPKGALAPAAKVVTHPDPLGRQRRPSSGYSETGEAGFAESIGTGNAGSADSLAVGAAAASSSGNKGDFKRRNPQLSLRLDPRYRPAGTAHKLSDRSSDSKSSLSSASASLSAHSASKQTPEFKEPRLPNRPVIHHRSGSSSHNRVEATPSLTPDVGRSPIWVQTPGLVPLAQSQAMRSTPSRQQAASPQDQQNSQISRAVASGPGSSSNSNNNNSSSKTKASTHPPPTALAPTFSVAHIREHIKSRLSTAKSTCDKELRKIINGITVYVENELESERAFLSSQGSRQELEEEEEALQDDSMDQDTTQLLLPAPPLPPMAGQHVEDSDAGNEAEDELDIQPGDDLHREGGIAASSSRPPYRPLQQQQQLPPAFHRRDTDSSNSTPVSQHASQVGSPSATLHHPPRYPSTSNRGRSSGTSSPHRLSLGPRRYAPGAPVRPADLAARLEQSLQISNQQQQQHQPDSSAPVSRTSSRSTSRSRSPMPGAIPIRSAGSASARRASSAEWYGSHRHHPTHLHDRTALQQREDEDKQHFLTSLQTMVSIALEIIDTSVADITADPSICALLIRRVQQIGKRWDDHPSWPLRGWYVQLLLAVAGLSRVAEFWAEERGFWNFEDTKDDEAHADDITFVAKPSYDEEHSQPSTSARSRAPSVATHLTAAAAAAIPKPGNRGGYETPLASPLGIDLGVNRAEEQVASHQNMTVTAPAAVQPEDTHVGEAEVLREAVEEVRNATILMELQLDGESFQYLSPVWTDVIGLATSECLGKPISHLLHPDDVSVFVEATTHLLHDDSHTIEAHFRLRIFRDDEDSEDLENANFEHLEGKGMLIRDRLTGAPSHTMWVVRPGLAPAGSNTSDEGEPSTARPGGPHGTFSGPRTFGDVGAPFATMRGQTLSVAPILCRICDKQIPTWFFEKHNETCNETHRLEVDISDCNDRLVELRGTMSELCSSVKQSAASPSEASSSSLEYAGTPLLPARYRDGQIQVLNELLDMLAIALDVSTPSISDESVPIGDQRLLSPNSEDHLTVLKQWHPPTSEDPALRRLAEDLAELCQQKIMTVNRLRNTIYYVERIRVEWENQAQALLATVPEEGSESPPASPAAADSNARVEQVSQQDASGGTTALLPAAVSERGPSNETTPMPPLVGKFSSEGGGPTPSTLSPSMASERLAASLGDADPTAKPSPTLVPTSGGQVITSTSLSRSGTDSPVPMTTYSPAGLLSPLPMLDPNSKQVASPSTAAAAGIPSGGPSAARSPQTNNNSTAVSTTAISSVNMSPRIPSSAPQRGNKTSSIKDFDIIKPISKGAFGSVYLAKKRTTGDYYAIKVLKKADMIAKNQVTNVKAERKILMTQADSDFAVKLYWTFQSKDYLYLVMEYLNGGDCAALIKVMGALDEQWAKSYIAEIVLGLEYLHARGIVHRDLKPDNLLIDSRGHLRLTDFGLSRFGQLGRQARAIQTTTQHGHGHGSSSATGSSYRRMRPHTSRSFSRARRSGQSTPDSQPKASYFGSLLLEESDQMSESSGSESVGVSQANLKRNSRPRLDSPAVSHDSGSGNKLALPPSAAAASPSKNSDTHRFVGTVDYVAPESILGVGVGEGVDWWALGVICHEFLTAYPPFHASTPDKVFDNILSRRIDWHEDEVEMSPEARDFIDRLLAFDPSQRLGANGADEVKRHPFLAGIDWVNLRTEEANFVPQVQDPESTDYFDSRGATHQVFEDDANDEDEARLAKARNANTQNKDLPDHQQEQQQQQARPHGGAGPRTSSDPADLEEARRSMRERQETSASDDFGSFVFKNLDVLKQANDDVIRKLRSDQLIPSAMPPSDLPPRSRYDQLGRKTRPKRDSIGIDPRNGPPSPATSTTSSVGSGATSTVRPPAGFMASSSHSRRPSELLGSGSGARAKPANIPGSDAQIMMDDNLSRRNSLPARMRRASFSISSEKRNSQDPGWRERRRTSGYTDLTPASSVSSPVSNKASLPPVPQGSQHPPLPPLNTDLSSGTSPVAPGAVPGQEKTVDCLIAEDNPISSKILETILVRLGCICVVVQNGEEAIRCTMGEIAFDVIFMDMLMPILDGENAARMIKSTKNANQNTPIVAVTSYAAHDQPQITEEGTVFNAVLTKPVNKKDVLNVLSKLGFVAKTKSTSSNPAAPIMTRSTSSASNLNTAGTGAAPTQLLPLTAAAS